MSVRIIVDSTTDLPEQTARRVTVVPLTIHFGEQQYVSGVDIDARKFYEMLVEGDVLPTTSQPTPYAFTQVFQEAVDAGDTVVCITVSSKLSGTYQSACIAAADFPGKVFVVDSLTVAIGGGILTEYALSLTDKGMDAEEIAWKLMQKREKVRAAGAAGYPGVSEKGRTDFLCRGLCRGTSEHQAGDCCCRWGSEDAGQGPGLQAGQQPAGPGD